MVKYGKINGKEYKIIKMSKGDGEFTLGFLTHDRDGNLSAVGEVTITKSQAKTLGKSFLGMSIEDHIPKS